MSKSKIQPKSKSKEGLDKYKKKDNHYIDKKEFYNEMAAFKTDPENVRLVANGERPIIPDSIARKILLLCERHSYNHKFGNRFPFRDEMVLDAVETCIRYIWNFDETKYDNPYGYFNLCISREFIKRIKKEKKDFIKRAKYIQNLGVMEEFMDNSLFADNTISGGEQAQLEIMENLQRFLEYDTDSYDRKEKEKKLIKKQKKAEDSLDAFTEPAMNPEEIIIKEYHDGFSIEYIQGNKRFEFRFNQEDTIEKMKDLFLILGYETTYREEY